MAFERWPLPAEAPAPDDLSKCVHCGLCVNACPTYLVTGLEVESPRGRIALARGVQDGVIPLTEVVQSHWDLCLQCRACEVACPSGVPYGRIMEHARAQIAAKPPSGGTQRRVRRFVLRNVVARPRVLAAAVAPVRWYAGSRLRRVLRASRATHLLGRFRATETQLPWRPGKPVRPGDDLPAGPEGSPEAVLFTGCVMGEIFGGVHSATARVLARNGVTPLAAAGQGCCGALSAHDGDLEFARKLARANIAGLEGSDAPIIVNSAGCGAALKEYGDLLIHDSEWSARAARFAGRVRDLSEYLVELGAPVDGTFEGKVTYQDPCHLAHAQRIREQPRTLLAGAGCDLTETAGADTCCGAAGIYSLVQPEMSAQLRARKAEQFARHRPDVIVTGNPGCQMQYEAAVAEAGVRARVMHIAEVLDEAYARSERSR